LGAVLIGHAIETVRSQGWVGTKNGALLNLVGSAGFEALITVDKNLPRQQVLNGLPFGVVVLRARSNNLRDLEPLAPKILAALQTLKAGQAVVVSGASTG
jgi:hypothetical protein